ncbi:hypothetical protein [uncultured Kordia sp.]|uniref:hypothetical protein n=1 Tax=uncultured Kordia sp. TaxID=507699 RepID=UPI0026102912|nr:hypothetical protein [uncultured Kordia sp.]
MGKPNLVIDREQKKVFLDGEIIGKVDTSNSYSGKEEGDRIIIEDVFKLDDILISNLFKYNFEDLVITFDEIFFSCYGWLKESAPAYYKWYPNSSSHIYLSRSCKPIVDLRLFLYRWDFSFSVKSFIETLSVFIQNDETIRIDSEILKNPSLATISVFSLYFDIDIEFKKIKVLYEEVVEQLKLKIDLTISELTQQNNSNLSNTFTFPPEIQSSCEQYLIYFATFLKDIGINAETKIESKAHKTLFTVIPANGEEALDKIKKALQIYLSLPESPEFESVASEFTDMSVQRLASQVYFYKSQLALASVMLQEKDKQIKSLNMKVYQQEASVELQVLEEKNEEKVFGGLVTITEFKLNGFKINSPEMVRFLKRVFKIK